MNTLENKLYEFFCQGCKSQECLGLELEHFIINPAKNMTVPYEGEKGVRALLESIKDQFAHLEYEGEYLVGMAREKISISIEPGSQLEVSVTPQSDLSIIKEEYEKFLQLIQPFLEKNGYELKTMGSIPKDMLEKVRLIPKDRYRMMKKHFELVGSLGYYMMEGSASLQVSLDFTSERDFVEKYRVANFLAPLIYGFTYNNPYQSKAIGRAEIWENVDSTRCGMLTDIFQPDFGFAAYAKALMKVPGIFVKQQEEYKYTGEKLPTELEGEYGDDFDMAQHMMNIVFPDVRLKQYMEIRMGDSMDIDSAMGYCAFLKGIFYHKENLHTLQNQMGGNMEMIEEANKQISMSHTRDTKIYGKPFGQWVEELFGMARNGLCKQECMYLDTFYTFVQERMEV